MPRLLVGIVSLLVGLVVLAALVELGVQSGANPRMAVAAILLVLAIGAGIAAGGGRAHRADTPYW